MAQPGWDDPLVPCCPEGGSPLHPCGVRRTPAGRWWCDYHLVAFGGEAHASEAAFVADYFTGYRHWVCTRNLEHQVPGVTTSSGGTSDTEWYAAAWRLLGGFNEVWQPGARHEGQCPAGKAAPCANPCKQFGHGCGIYATKDFRQAEWVGTADGAVQGRRALYQVYGEVGLWGRVYEHGTGWRAQYAYPLCLYGLPPGYGNDTAWAACVAAVAAEYGVPVEDPPPPDVRTW